MKTKLTILLLAGLLAAPGFLRAQMDTNGLDAKEIAELKQVMQLVKNLKYEQGEIDLGGGLAKLTVPKDFNFLASEDAETVLVKLWGNPPSKEKPLGLLIPAGMTPLSSNAWVVTIDYSEDGFVKDDDAAKINYDDLLKKMQKGIVEDNKARKEQGYPEVTLVGWAEPPHYDATTHKLYWAKQLKFEGEKHDTLNYSIRMLGRKGVLELNAIAGMNQLGEINGETPKILGMVDFKEGSRYADFDPKVDKVAAYGIAALVAGGIAAKMGLFKVLLVGLLAAKKFVIIGVIAVAAFIKKLFNRGGNSSGGTPST
ncbi:MAG TPA: DUF2167 domain-containing protein [bacterium]|nr:DUF2167 domain-containing protein [bacterium]